jgi:hypothetical protein
VPVGEEGCEEEGEPDLAAKAEKILEGSIFRGLGFSVESEKETNRHRGKRE